MMKTTGRMVVHVLSGPTRQMLRRFSWFREATDVRRGASKGGAVPLFAIFPPHVSSDDRRTFQRLKLTKPILALMDGANALVLDIGVSGALVEHYGTPEPGDTFILSFRWQGTDIEFVCEVVRTLVERDPAGDGKSTVSHTGVKFTKPIGDSLARLEDFMATFVGRVLAAQRANAAGEPRGHTTILEQLGGARRSRTRGFVSYRLKGDTWWRVPTSSSAQPADGFTVAAHEDDDEVESLCKTYETADEEGRQLIRLVAELSARGPRP